MSGRGLRRSFLSPGILVRSSRDTRYAKADSVPNIRGRENSLLSKGERAHSPPSQVRLESPVMLALESVRVLGTTIHSVWQQDYEK